MSVQFTVQFAAAEDYTIMKRLFITSMRVVGFAALVQLTSCATPPGDEGSAVQSTTRPAGRHAIHTERLQAIMAGLGQQTVKTWPQEIADERAADVERQREGRFAEAQEMAYALARAAELIPQAAAGAPLADADRTAFLGNVDRLRTLAISLQTSAAAHDFDRMHSVLHDIRATCNGCHSQFRAIAGPIPWPNGAL